MKNRNKGAAISVSMAALLMAGAISGCGNTAGTENKAGENSPASATDQNEEQLDVIKVMGMDWSRTDNNGKQVYLSEWVNGDSKLWDRLESDLAERGIRLEVDLIPEDQYETVIQTQIASGLSCDFVNITGVDNKTISNLVNQGKLLAINEIWSQYSQEDTKKFYDEGIGSEIAKLNRMENGNVYKLSGITVGDYNGTQWGSFTGGLIRKDWLDKLGLKKPETTEELFEALKAFADQDMNGSGSPDEVVTVDLGSFGTGIAQCFGLGVQPYFIDYETGKANSPWYQEGIKDYIRYMNRLHQEGLLDTSGQGTEKRAENKVSFLTEWWVETWVEPAVNTPEGEAKPYFDGILCKGLEGVNPLISRQSAIQKGGNDFAVTSNADPEAIGRLLDYLASEEYSVLTEYGIEGYSYELDEDGKKVALDPGDNSEVQLITQTCALWTENGIFPRMEITDRAQELEKCAEAGLTMGYPETGFADKAQTIRDVYENEDKYHYAYLNTEAELAAPTDEETEQIAELQADFETYYQELLTKLILGQLPLEDWDTYIAELKDLGLDELLEITQNRYDRIAK
ncbi:MAG: extracellular solute-binding protein [Eubacteriales bacterium]|nr:extracellular solute-binding protein [Eubacteriales bacterium]